MTSFPHVLTSLTDHLDVAALGFRMANVVRNERLNECKYDSPDIDQPWSKALVIGLVSSSVQIWEMSPSTSGGINANVI